MAQKGYEDQVMAREFWRSSGYHLVKKNADGHLLVSDDLLRAFLMRPELLPVAESNAAERALHLSLMNEPRRPVSEVELNGIEDPDAIDNYRVILAFRDRLCQYETVEAAYHSFFTKGGQLPPLFADQLVHLILRGMLDDCDWPLQLRAAELFFRTQKVTVQDGQIMLADEETLEQLSASGGLGNLGRLLVENQTPLQQVDLDVLTEENQANYWARSDRFDMVLDLSFARGGLDGLCRVMERWVARFLAITTRIHPLSKVEDPKWAWHLGLDRESSTLLNDLYQGREIDNDQNQRLLSLFRMEIKDQAAVLPQVAGRPIYLGLAMDTEKRVHMKPQNLLVNLPLANKA